MANPVKDKGPTRKQAGMDFLLKLLADGPMCPHEIYSAAEKIGIGSGSIQEAKRELNLTLTYAKATGKQKIGCKRSILVKWGLPGAENSNYRALEEAKGFLTDLLKNGPVASATIHTRGASSGIKIGQLQRAKKALGIQSVWIEVEEEEGRISHWAMSVAS